MSRMGFPDASVGKESACNAGDPGSIPGLGRSPGEGKGYPLQYSGLESMGLQRVGYDRVTFTFTFKVMNTELVFCLWRYGSSLILSSSLLPSWAVGFVIPSNRNYQSGQCVWWVLLPCRDRQVSCRSSNQRKLPGGGGLNVDFLAVSPGQCCSMCQPPGRHQIVWRG